MLIVLDIYATCKEISMDKKFTSETMRPFYVMLPNSVRDVYAKTKTQISFVVKLISAFVFATRIVQSPLSLIQNFKPLAIFCDCTARFVSDLVGNPEDRFSCVAAQMYLVLRGVLSYAKTKPQTAKLISAFVFATWFLIFNKFSIYIIMTPYYN